MCFRVRKAHDCARAVWELRQLTSSHCSKPLPSVACSYYCKVKTSLFECLRVSHQSIHTGWTNKHIEQKALRGRKDRISHVLCLWKFNRNMGSFSQNMCWRQCCFVLLQPVCLQSILILYFISQFIFHITSKETWRLGFFFYHYTSFSANKTFWTH